MLDADGSFAIRKFKQGSGYQYDCTILANQVDGGAIDYIYGVFGGSVYATKQYCDDDARREPTVYRWEVRGEKAAEIAKRVAPFLRIKKEQAQLLVRFRDLVNRHTTRRLSSGRGRFASLEPYEINERELCYLKMRELKTIIIPSAAVTTKQSSPSSPMGSDSLADEEQELVG
jgi:hypothetical protein